MSLRGKYGEKQNWKMVSLRYLVIVSELFMVMYTKDDFGF